MAVLLLSLLPVLGLEAKEVVLVVLKFFNLSFGLALCLSVALPVEAKLAVPTIDELPQLQPEGIHQTACTRTANTYIRAHYKSIQVNDAFADKVLKQYLDFLDYGKSLFTKGEVDEIYSNKARINRAILLCDLSYPYELYNMSLRKRFSKYSYFVKTLQEGKLDLTTDDYLRFDRKKSDFLPSAEAIQAEWLNELKNDYILQLLSDKTDAEAKKRLVRRYNVALTKLAQTKSEDVFSVFENSFATAIDPHTSYLSPEASEDFNDNLNLSLEGIGAVLSSEDEYTVINSIVPGSPAERSKKLKTKDKIVGVRQADGSYEDIIGWRLNDVVKKIKGPKGTKVTLDIERGEGTQMTTFSVDIIRDKIRLQDSEAKVEVKEHAGKRVGVLKIKSFYTNLHKDISKEIERVTKEGPIDALIVDLRNNGGGLLPEATASSGLFIKQGPVVLVRDARGNVVPQIDTDPSVAYDGPLVVLINRFSASSSEIMAAALRDYGRALVVGDTSFGKGTVQQSKPLARVYDFNSDELGSIHYTIAKFYRINGGSTQLKGVSPDIFLPTTIDTEDSGECNEDNALPWDKINAVSYAGYLNIDAYVPELSRLSAERSKNNKAFRILQDDRERYFSLKHREMISVNLDKRKAQRKEDDDYSLQSTNARLALMGKDPIKKLKDLPEDFEFDDAILDEAVAIASDFADAQKQKLYSAQSLPVLMRYQFNRDALSEGSGMVSPPGAAAMPARPTVLSAGTVAAQLQGADWYEAEAQKQARLHGASKQARAQHAASLSGKLDATATATPAQRGLEPAATATTDAAAITTTAAVVTAAGDANANAAANAKTAQAASASEGDHSIVGDLDSMDAMELDDDSDLKAKERQQQLSEQIHKILATGQSGFLTTPDGRPYQVITDTGEINNVALDGSLLGAWRTLNEDDTFLRQSETHFQELLQDSADKSTTVHLKDDLYPSLGQDRRAVAIKNANSGVIILNPVR